jgi:hypothetical protein
MYRIRSGVKRKAGPRERHAATEGKPLPVRGILAPVVPRYRKGPGGKPRLVWVDVAAIIEILTREADAAYPLGRDGSKSLWSSTGEV